MKGAWRQIDHTGDVAIEADAPTERDLFECCAAALFDIIVEPGVMAAPRERAIAVEAPDREILLVRWLRELLFLHETERWIFREFAVETGESPGGGRWLRGIARGETFDAAKHAVRTELKAVTYHQIAAAPDAAGVWRARVVFDI